MEARLTRKRGRGIASNLRNSSIFPLSINDVPHRTDNSICISQRNDFMSKCCRNSSTLHELQRERRPVFLCVFNRIPFIDPLKCPGLLAYHPGLRPESRLGHNERYWDQWQKTVRLGGISSEAKPYAENGSRLFRLILWRIEDDFPEDLKMLILAVFDVTDTVFYEMNATPKAENRSASQQ